MTVVAVLVVLFGFYAVETFREFRAHDARADASERERAELRGRLYEAERERADLRARLEDVARRVGHLEGSHP